MHLSFHQTEKPCNFPGLEFWNCDVLKGSNHVKPEATLNAPIAKLRLIWVFKVTSGPYSTWFEPNFKIQAQENNKVCLFEEMTNTSVPYE